jgi:glutamate N-acetyltransferase/amino-acid N-acetyltransferase
LIANEHEVQTIGVTAAAGFRASGVSCGIRRKGPDLALLVSDVAASAACVFTTNRVQAAPIAVCREHLAATGGVARAIVANSGNANACTGAPGLAAARRTAREAAALLGVPAEHVLVASTGVIGQPLPVDRLVTGLPAAVAALAASGGAEAAQAIMTTDTRRKESARRVALPAGTFAIGGMAKGSGMIHPNMATTLAFVTTDAAVPADRLARALRRAADRTFNRVSVDGDTSTNDTIALLANGRSGVAIGADEERAFGDALEAVLHDLALQIARDGEGATILIEVAVTGAATEDDALRVSRTIAGSPLVKTAIHGADANWGRIVAAAGRSGVAIEPERLSVALNGLLVLEPGYVSCYSEEEATARLRRDSVTVRVDLGQGDALATTWTCDLTAEYVAINASYRS